VKCPYCFEDIAESTVICPFCEKNFIQKMLEPAVVKLEEKKIKINFNRWIVIGAGLIIFLVVAVFLLPKLALRVYRNISGCTDSAVSEYMRADSELKTTMLNHQFEIATTQSVLDQLKQLPHPVCLNSLHEKNVNFQNKVNNLFNSAVMMTPSQFNADMKDTEAATGALLEELGSFDYLSNDFYKSFLDPIAAVCPLIPNSAYYALDMRLKAVSFGNSLKVENLGNLSKTTNKVKELIAPKCLEKFHSINIRFFESENKAVNKALTGTILSDLYEAEDAKNETISLYKDLRTEQNNTVGYNEEIYKLVDTHYLGDCPLFADLIVFSGYSKATNLLPNPREPNAISSLQGIQKYLKTIAPPVCLLGVHRAVEAVVEDAVGIQEALNDRNVTLAYLLISGFEKDITNFAVEAGKFQSNLETISQSIFD
jgi:hypothetical protein